MQRDLSPTPPSLEQRLNLARWRGGRCLRGYSDGSPPLEVMTKTKEGGRRCRAEKRAVNGNRSVQVEDDPWIGSDN